MQDPDPIRLFIVPLEELGLPYMITGGVAAVIYGDPRFTRDIDIVLELRPGDVERLVGGFSGADFYVPPEETLVEEVGRERGGHFNLIHGESALRADVYVAGDDPLHAWAFERRARFAVEEVQIWVAPIEYVILRKLEYYKASSSDRHLRDVAMMQRISGEIVDRSALERWVARLDLQEPLDEARAYEI